MQSFPCSVPTLRMPYSRTHSTLTPNFPASQTGLHGRVRENWQQCPSYTNQRNGGKHFLKPM